MTAVGAQQRQRRRQRQSAAALVLLGAAVLLCPSAAAAAAAAAAAPRTAPEPNCNTNVQESEEVWKPTSNFIGQGSGPHWWGSKAAHTATPVSWLDQCARQLELCQSNSRVAGPVEGFKEKCICDMWACLNKPPREPLQQDPALAATAVRPKCLHTQPYLLQYYCRAGTSISAVCRGPGHVALPRRSSACPAPPTHTLSFDDATDAALGLAIPSGYKNLRWDNFGIMDGDSYQTHNGYFSGVVSSPNVAFNIDGMPGTIVAPGNGSISLHSLYLTSAWDADNLVTITAEDEDENEVGRVQVVVDSDGPVFVDLRSSAAAPGTPSSSSPVELRTGSFEGVKAIIVETRGSQVVLDNVHLTLAALPGSTLELLPAVPPPGARDEAMLWRSAPPGATTPDKKDPQEKRQQRTKFRNMGLGDVHTTTKAADAPTPVAAAPKLAAATTQAAAAP